MKTDGAIAAVPWQVHVGGIPNSHLD